MSALPLSILAFGSLIGDPGPELASVIIDQKLVRSPVQVEYGRYSGETRGGAPTLVPHPKGSFVDAHALVLNRTVSIEVARDMLWRRETGKAGTQEKYVRRNCKNCVLIEERECNGLRLLYVDFNDEGKISEPNPSELARRAIASVKTAPLGKDGISYLANALQAGIITPLSEQYSFEVLRQSGGRNLREALNILRNSIKEGYA